MFVGCGKNENSSSAVTDGTSSSDEASNSSDSEQTDDTNDSNYMKSVVDSLTESIGVSGAGELDKSLAQDMIGLNMENVEDLYGVFSMMNVKSDAIVMVKAKPGEADSV